MPDAVERLHRAFRIGRERQVYGAHSPTKARLAELCRVALTEEIEPDYTRTLIRRRQLVANPPPVDVPNWPWPVRIRTFGALEIVLDVDTAVSLGRTKMPALLLLALVAFGAGERTVEVEKIVSVLWPDADGDMGMRAFDVTVLRLRRLLGHRGRDAVRVERGRLSLDKSICWTDVDALDAIHATATLEGRPGIAAVDPKTLGERLLKLYRGPFGGETVDVPAAFVTIQKGTRLKTSVTIAALGRRLGEQEPGAEEALYMRALTADAGLTLRLLLVQSLSRRGHQRRARELIAAWRLHDDAELFTDLTDAARSIGA